MLLVQDIKEQIVFSPLNGICENRPLTSGKLVYTPLKGDVKQEQALVC